MKILILLLVLAVSGCQKGPDFIRNPIEIILPDSRLGNNWKLLTNIDSFKEKEELYKNEVLMGGYRLKYKKGPFELEHVVKVCESKDIAEKDFEKVRKMFKGKETPFSGLGEYSAFWSKMGNLQAWYRYRNTYYNIFGFGMNDVDTLKYFIECHINFLNEAEGAFPIRKD